VSTLHEAAIYYASIGWPVFPIRPGEKTPLTQHGVKDATTDEETINGWWNKWPEANIAVACGQPSKLYVVDVDYDVEKGKNGYESIKTFALPATVCQHTPRGGMHLLYRQPGTLSRNATNVLPDVDLRGDGGYILLAPSLRTDGKMYSWKEGCAPWERTIVDFPDFMRIQNASQSEICDESDSSDASDDIFQRARTYLSHCDPAVQGHGGHGKLLWAASALIHGFGLSNRQAWELLKNDFNPRCVPPWNIESDGADFKDFRRKVIEARRVKPRHPHLWLLNDSAYQPVGQEEISKVIDLDSLLGRNKEVVDTEEEKEDADKAAWFQKEEEFLINPPGLVGEMCDWLNSTAIVQQPLHSLAASLVFCGTIMGRKVKTKKNNHPNLFCMTVADSSAGKGNAINQLLNLAHMSGCFKLIGSTDTASGIAIESLLAKRHVACFLWDEVGFLLTDASKGRRKHLVDLLKILMDLWSKAGSVYPGRSYADTEKQRKLINPCCCIYGASTPSRFYESLSREQLKDGWLSRCLVFKTDKIPKKDLRKAENNEIPIELIEHVRQWTTYIVPIDGNRPNIEQIAQYIGEEDPDAKPPLYKVVEISEEAHLIFDAFNNECEGFAKSDEEMKEIWLKACEYALRVSLIIACGRSFDDPIIEIEDAMYACRLIRFLHMSFSENVIGNISDSSIERDRSRLLESIRRLGKRTGVQWGRLSRATSWCDMNTRKKLLDELVEFELVRVEYKGTIKWVYPLRRKK
jgi:hypothetical protein